MNNLFKLKNFISQKNFKWIFLISLFTSFDANAFIAMKNGCIEQYPEKYKFTGKYLQTQDYQIIFESKEKYLCDFLDKNDNRYLGCTNGMEIVLLNDIGQVRSPTEDPLFTKNLKISLNNQELFASAIDSNISKNFKLQCDFKDLKNKRSKEIVSNEIQYKFRGRDKTFSINYILTSNIVF